MGTNCAPLLADLFLYLYEAVFIPKLMREKNKTLDVTFYSTLRYIDDVLSINNNYFHSYVNSIYPSELEMKDTKNLTYVSYLDILPEKDNYDNQQTKLYDKLDDFNFSSSTSLTYVAFIIYHHHLLLQFMTLSLFVMQVSMVYIRTIS